MKLIEPIDTSLTTINFYDMLHEMVTKMDSNTITFSVSILENNKIEPLETIIEMITSKKKMTITKDVFNKQGKSCFKIIFNEFEFVSINNLFDFDYSNSCLLNLVVSYTFKNIEYVNDNDLIMQRTLKIYKLLNKDYDKFHLTKSQLNIK
jgi:hypothetical protein